MLDDALGALGALEALDGAGSASSTAAVAAAPLPTCSLEPPALLSPFQPLLDWCTAFLKSVTTFVRRSTGICTNY